MTTTIKMISLAILTVINLASLEVNAQDTAAENKTTFSIETDPSTFAFKGYAFHIRIKPGNSKRLVIGAGTYALSMPGIMVDMNKDNKDKGWNVRIKSAYSLFGEYYFKEANNKWFVGLQAGVQNFRNTNNNIAGKESKYGNLILMPSIGYNWQPLKFPMYVKPWFGVGYTSNFSGNGSIDNFKYDISPLIPFVTLHVGYTFNK